MGEVGCVSGGWRVSRGRGGVCWVRGEEWEGMVKVSGGWCIKPPIPSDPILSISGSFHHPFRSLFPSHSFSTSSCIRFPFPNSFPFPPLTLYLQLLQVVYYKEITLPSKDYGRGLCVHKSLWIWIAKYMCLTVSCVTPKSLYPKEIWYSNDSIMVPSRA